MQGWAWGADSSGVGRGGFGRQSEPQGGTVEGRGLGRSSSQGAIMQAIESKPMKPRQAVSLHQTMPLRCRRRTERTAVPI